jgi:uracil-DNA glycosylase family 4
MGVAFERLVAEAQACRRCPSMEGRRRVLGAANGPLTAAIMLVGEAPGRLGAERTGVPFVGDASGQRLDRLLAVAGWTRADDVFITNAVLCNPRDARDRNRPPSAGELATCRTHLEATLTCVQPRLVVALGRRALKALAAIEPHDLQRAAPGRIVGWNGRWLTWMVHPSPLAGARRAWTLQCQDWRNLRRAFDAMLR